jgi:uncharacterized membrane protein
VSQPTSHTLQSDAPLSAAKDIEAAAVDDSLDGQELVGRTITVDCPRQEVYEFWRDFQNLPLFMENIEHVTIIDEQRSHWVVCAPGGRTVEWDSILVQDIPGEVISWRSAEGADISNSGRIEFRDAPGNRGTQVTATIVYDPPAGTIGKIIAKLFQKEPKIQARHDLRRFKQLLETGEISTSIRSPQQLLQSSH